MDIVLGMDWLKTWNPVIDWRKQTLYTWVHGQWEHVNGVLLDAEQRIGTVKIFEGYSGDSHIVPDISVIKEPKFWDWNTTQKEWMHVDVVKEKKNENDTDKDKETVPFMKQVTSIG